MGVARARRMASDSLCRVLVKEIASNNKADGSKPCRSTCFYVIIHPDLAKVSGRRGLPNSKVLCGSQTPMGIRNIDADLIERIKSVFLSIR